MEVRSWIAAKASVWYYIAGYARYVPNEYGDMDECSELLEGHELFLVASHSAK